MMKYFNLSHFLQTPSLQEHDNLKLEEKLNSGQIEEVIRQVSILTEPFSMAGPGFS